MNSNTDNANANANANAASLDIEAIRAELVRLRAENEALKLRPVKAPQAITCKVSEKGAVSLYGMGKWPVTLYKEQMLRLLDASDRIKAFIKENDGALKSKGDEKAV
jgi:hypothetical protein